MANETTTVRRCIGSARFGIEPHDAPVEDFPRQPSQKDGLGRLCRTHWNQYTSALRKAALARKDAEGAAGVEAVPTEAAPEERPEAIQKRAARRSQTLVAEAGSQDDAG